MGFPLRFIAGAITGGIAAYRTLSTQFGITRLRDNRSRKIASLTIKKERRLRKKNFSHKQRGI